VGFLHDPPLYPVLVGLLIPVTGNPEQAARILGMLLGTGVVLAGYGLDRRLFRDELAALLAGLLLAFCPPLIWQSGCVRNFGLWCLLWSMAILATWRAGESLKVPWAIAAGILWAAAYYARFEALVAALVAAGWLVYQAWQNRQSQGRPPMVDFVHKAGLIAGGMLFFLLLACLPYFVFVHGLIGRWVPAPRFDDISYPNFIYYETGLTIPELPHVPRDPHGLERLTVSIATIPRALKSIWFIMNPMLWLAMAMGLWTRRNHKGAGFLLLMGTPALSYVFVSGLTQNLRYYIFLILLLMPLAALGLCDLYRGHWEGWFNSAKFRWFSLMALVPLLIFWGWQFNYTRHREPLPFLQTELLVAAARRLASLPMGFYLESLIVMQLFCAVIFLLRRRLLPAVIFIVISALFLGVMIFYPHPPDRSALLWTGPLQALATMNAREGLLVLGLLAALIIYFCQADRLWTRWGQNAAFSSALAVLITGWLFALAVQNSWIRTEMTRDNAYIDKPAALAGMVGRLGADTRLMSRSPRIAYELGVHWVKLPPVEPLADLDVRHVDLVVLDDFMIAADQQPAMRIWQEQGLIRNMGEVLLGDPRHTGRWITMTVHRVAMPWPPAPGPGTPGWRLEGQVPGSFPTRPYRPKGPPGPGGSSPRPGTP